MSYNFETLEVKVDGGVAHVMLNRPKKLNAMNNAFWREFRECFVKIGSDPAVRAVVVSGNGRMFTAGLDLMDMANLAGGQKDVGRKAFSLYNHVQLLQDSFTAIERCPQPVISATHGACIGGGIDLISACDIRFASPECWFTIKEVDIGLAADVGTLQRITKIVGNEGIVKELAYTARKFTAAEAKEFGFITKIVAQDQLLKEALDLASVIASKSPIAVAGTKHNINYSRDHTVEDSLKHIALWNSAMLQSKDVMIAAQASLAKKKATFAKL
eukprot:TRINITY_DN4205_c1_g2_i1.p1 TRINITY_DN4205_c1_g2~~TRINITY_DN4205_c1_g2_i1.p1  ORF type:complete len:272 (+),score=57.01 TRINITY_DN4205_c1_g2_i1:62-877(+)